MVLNIPPILNEDIVKKAFQQIAKVQRIVLTNESKMFSAELDSSRKDSCFGFKIAYVVFAKPSGKLFCCFKFKKKKHNFDSIF